MKESLRMDSWDRIGVGIALLACFTCLVLLTALIVFSLTRFQ